MPIITPTVGRVVLFRPGIGFAGIQTPDGDPLPALISRVWNDRLINIGGFDADGKPFSATNVPLIQGDEPEGQALPQFYAEWMPYQKGQAAKTEALEAKIAAASPASDGDNAIEKEIQAKGLTAPRVTPADIEANIADVEIVKHVAKSGQVLRWAVITTQSGFAVTGDPSCAVSSENDNQEIGEKVAIENARSAMWPLMGYELKQRLHDQFATG